MHLGHNHGAITHLNTCTLDNRANARVSIDLYQLNLSSKRVGSKHTTHIRVSHLAVNPLDGDNRAGLQASRVPRGQGPLKQHW